jgi:hypothetical protein
MRNPRYLSHHRQVTWSQTMGRSLKHRPFMKSPGYFHAKSWRLNTQHNFLFFTNLLSKVLYKTLYRNYCKEMGNCHYLIFYPFFLLISKKIQKIAKNNPKNIVLMYLNYFFGIFSVFSKEIKNSKIYFQHVRFLTRSFQNYWSILLSRRWHYLLKSIYQNIKQIRKIKKQKIFG